MVSSLPHYRSFNTDRQRGEGVFEQSIEALKLLNAVGYGRDPKLRLVLVTNPVGAFLPPSQESLERDYRDSLGRELGITFDHLLTEQINQSAITNTCKKHFCIGILSNAGFYLLLFIM